MEGATYRMMAKVALLLAGLVASGLLCEAGVRVLSKHDPQLRYLALAGTANNVQLFTSLEELVAARPQVSPHRNLYNYYTNSLGFNDLELTAKSPGSRRIIALGDSFCHGVSYPQAALTRVEALLAERCPGRPLDLLNLCIPATGVWEYRAVYELSRTRLEPDFVIMHFYMGNDGPDLLTGANELPHLDDTAIQSYGWNLMRNLWTLWRGIESTPPLPSREPSPAKERGGQQVVPYPPLDDTMFTKPAFTEEAYLGMAAGEIGRFFRPDDERVTRAAWRPILDIIDSLKGKVAGDGHPFVIVLYPSALQVYPEFFAASVARQGEGDERPGTFDPRAPNKVMLSYCEQAGVPCLDLTGAVVEASEGGKKELYFPHDTHWNFSGHAAVGRAEAELLGPVFCQVAP